MDEDKILDLLRRVKEDLEAWITGWENWTELPPPPETMALIAEIDEVLNRE